MKGITNGKLTICVMNMNPVRKKPCLCVIDGNVITKYASFNNDKAADDFIKILAQVANVQIEKESEIEIESEDKQ